MTTIAATSRNDSYLTLVPRGLHQIVLDCMTEKLTPRFYLKTTLLNEHGDQDLERLGPLVQEANNKKSRNFASTCPGGVPVGTTHDANGTGRHVSMGYCPSSASSSSIMGVISYPGVAEGMVWIQFDTDAPVEVVANQLRCVGPLLALVHTFSNISLGESQSLSEAVIGIEATVVATRDYSLDAAVNLWQRHVTTTWPLSPEDQHDMEEIVKGASPVKFRLSCIRNQSKRYKYAREDLLRSLADIVVPNAREENKQNQWVVDLTRYNVEVVLLVRPTCMAVALTLRPYRYHGAKAFSSGTVPPDLAAPYLSGSVLSGLVRLRPSTANALLHLAQVQPGDVVLDPCAGIGTIPMELPHLGRSAFAMGGDVVLTSSGLGSVASNYIQHVKNIDFIASDLMAWDAIQLPLRSSSVDVIVSDLPFGQQCLSSSKLDTLLPLLFSEMARVLSPSTGRMVLLCGSYAPPLETLLYLNQVAKADGDDACNIWTLPCTAVFPVNVGGLMAWVVQVKRGQGKLVPIPNHAQRVKKVARNRERIARHRAREQEVDSHSKHRRIQS